MVPFSTEEVARKVGINRVTLERWLSTGKISAPRTVRYGRNVFRDWTTKDLERLKKYKHENYRKGRGRRPKLKK